LDKASANGFELRGAGLGCRLAFYRTANSVLSVPGDLPEPSPAPPTGSLDLRVRADLLRTAYHDGLYGASFAFFVILVFAYAIHTAFPARIVIPWLALALVCNTLRLVSRWAYLRQPVPAAETHRWELRFVAVSGVTGLSWGVGAWLFYTPEDSIYRVMVVLVIAGMTTGASRLLAPIRNANLAYVYFSIGPLMAKLLLNPDTRSYTMGMFCVLYLAYMSIAARQQAGTLHRTVRLGYENAALVESLGAAKERAERLNAELSAEIQRREGVETELRQASASALAASQAKSDFLATMSHEIRTPMNGIIGMLRIVSDTPLTPDQRDHIETASTSADKLLDLLSNILDFSKIESGHLELERIVFSPGALVQQVADLLRPRAAAKSLELVASIDPALPAGVLGDPTRLRQVLFNLLGNAIKFTDRGRITLSATVATAENGRCAVTFRVADTGIGIDPDAQARLFRPFTQGDSSMSRRFGGTGLGLAISQKLVDAMGGTVAAESNPGQGAVFHFTLPFETAAPSPIIPARSATLPRLRGRVLVVEDDRVNQRVILHILKQLGLETNLAEDGEAAVTMALDASWDAILMDCQLPHLDGLEATRRIRARHRGAPLPIIALTANAGTHDRAACFAAGMDDFLSKPVRVEILAATLQKWLPRSADVAAQS
jgi:signal transduction histidine kinase/ActR/RegA family two-component response regulator